MHEASKLVLLFQSMTLKWLLFPTTLWLLERPDQECGSAGKKQGNNFSSLFDPTCRSRDSSIGLSVMTFLSPALELLARLSSWPKIRQIN
jgi:hypothetical protein